MDRRGRHCGAPGRLLPGRAGQRAPYLLAGEEQHPKHSEETQVYSQQQPDAGGSGERHSAPGGRTPAPLTRPSPAGSSLPRAGPAQPLSAPWQKCNSSNLSQERQFQGPPGLAEEKDRCHQPGPALRGQPRESWGWGCGERVGGQGWREVSGHGQGRKRMQDGAGGRGQGKAVKRAALGARQRPPNACLPTSPPGQKKGAPRPQQRAETPPRPASPLDPAPT